MNTSKQIEAYVQAAEQNIKDALGTNPFTIYVNGEDNTYGVDIEYHTGDKEITEHYASGYYFSELEELVTVDLVAYCKIIYRREFHKHDTPLEETTTFRNPFSMFVGNEWSYVSDYADSNEYMELDDIWNVFDDISYKETDEEIQDCIDRYNEGHDTNFADFAALKAEYATRFAKMFGQVLSDIGNDLINGNITLKFEDL